MKQFICVLIYCLSLIIVAPTFAQEFRAFNQIPTPGRSPDGATPVQTVQPISTNTLQNATEQIVNAWNSGNLSQHLSDEFYDKSRFIDTMTLNVPKDANIRLISLQGGQTINQFERINPAGKKEIISTVSVNAQTQVEFNDINRGFRRLEGTNEYIIRITEEVQ